MSRRILKSVRNSCNHSLIWFLPALMLGLLIQFAVSTDVSADEIYFKSGYSHTGVIIRETENAITIKTEMGMMTVDRDNIDFVEKASKEENQVLLRKWREKEQQLKEAQQAKRAEEKKFEESQLAKGFVKFEDKWLTPEEKARILDLRARAVEHRRQFEAEQQAKGLVRFQYLWVTPERAKELRQMEVEISRLYDDITTRKRMVESLRAAMATTSTIEEADKFSQRIENVNKGISEKTEQLGKLLDRADAIEAESVRYVMPEEFREVMTPGTNTE